MLRNYIAAALRNMARNRLYTAINVLGLAVGFAAVLLIGLFIRDELTYERWMSGSERTYLFMTEVHFANGTPPVYGDASPRTLADGLVATVPEIEAATRLYNQPTANDPLEGIRRGDVEAEERLYWADPNIFAVLPLPMVAGDAAALDRPDGIVITRRMARKYFGRDDARGETLELNRQQTLTVTAVIEDLPSNTHLSFDLLASSRAPFAESDRQGRGVYTYVRLKPGVDEKILQNAVGPVLAQLGVADRLRIQRDNGVNQTYPFARIKDIHLAPGTATWIQKPRGNPQTLRSLGLVALSLIVLAAINFAGLTTARAAQRAVEVGVRKASGATRLDLALQFIGESLLTTIIAMGAAVASVALLAPRLGAFLGRDSIAFNLAADGMLALSVLGATILVGALAGLYPALVLPAFKVASVLKGNASGRGGPSRLRQGVVVFQFSVLIALILTSAIVYRQTKYAFEDGMRLDTAQVLLARTSCVTAFKDEVAKLPGVAAAACSSNMALNYEWGQFTTKRGDGTPVEIDDAMVGIGFFELYGVKPIAGRFFQQDNAMDTADAPRTLVVNETAVRALGFASHEAALGQSVQWEAPYRPNRFQQGPYQIVGVTPDIWLDAVHEAVRPVAYAPNPKGYQILSIKLKGQDIPETLSAINRVWAATGEPKPLTYSFLDQRVQELYLDIMRQSQFFTALSATAIVIAMLGLFALSAFTAEQSTKEIGIRKSMGATRQDILRLLLWQFTKPVLWANLIAWPAAYYLMQRWLEGFAYHVDLAPWMFVAASALAVVIALTTVTGHALLVARACPVTALRYE